ncbi:MAG: Mth938-like domain-containing protein [Gammaproteobacteria bacterium]|jgi:uncharacterized protein
MRFSLDTPPGISISACSDAGVEIAGTLYRSSILVLPDEVREWRCPDIHSLDAETLAPAVDHRPDILLLGSGRALAFPDAALTRRLGHRGIGLEVMDTAAACRTFNILTGEGRHVVAALVIDTP